MGVIKHHLILTMHSSDKIVCFRSWCGPQAPIAELRTLLEVQMCLSAFQINIVVIIWETLNMFKLYMMFSNMILKVEIMKILIGYILKCVLKRKLFWFFAYFDTNENFIRLKKTYVVFNLTSDLFSICSWSISYMYI